jgi:pilus assembly protein FimV
MGKLSAPVKLLASGMAILAMLIPVAGHALGLGNIAMKSALNQPLDAQVELLSVRKGDLNNLAVKLGSEEDFQRVGADRAFFLTKIKFEVVSRKNGTAYVQLSTIETVTEPFLDFVVEARWPRGRILREFTVLVDPPVLSD